MPNRVLGMDIADPQQCMPDSHNVVYPEGWELGFDRSGIRAGQYVNSGTCLRRSNAGHAHARRLTRRNLFTPSLQALDRSKSHIVGTIDPQSNRLSSTSIQSLLYIHASWRTALGCRNRIPRRAHGLLGCNALAPQSMHAALTCSKARGHQRKSASTRDQGPQSGMHGGLRRGRLVPTEVCHHRIPQPRHGCHLALPLDSNGVHGRDDALLKKRRRAKHARDTGEAQKRLLGGAIGLPLAQLLDLEENLAEQCMSESPKRVRGPRK